MSTPQALSVVNAVGSLIARTTQLGVYCHAGRENAVASTKAFTTQVHTHTHTHTSSKSAVLGSSAISRSVLAN